MLFPYLIDWLDGNFVKAALAVAFLMFLLCFDNLQTGFVIECMLVICLLGMALVSMYWPGLATFENIKLLLYGVLTVVGWSGGRVCCSDNPLPCNTAKKALLTMSGSRASFST